MADAEKKNLKNAAEIEHVSDTAPSRTVSGGEDQTLAEINAMNQVS